MVNSIDKVRVEKSDKVHFKTRLKLLSGYWATFCKRIDTLLAHYIEEQFKSEEYFKHDKLTEGELAYITAQSEKK